MSKERNPFLYVKSKIMGTKTNEMSIGIAYSYLRWSTKAQDLGDSERRQLGLAEAFCKANGLRLAEKTYADRGVSAFKGKNRDGELGQLLAILRPGNYLLVEDMDRLSRQDWLSAINFLNEIVVKGVIVVTLANGNRITAQTLRDNPGVFLPAILRAHLGNDENQKKAARIQASWDVRKQNLKAGKAVRQRLPVWLQWDPKQEKVIVHEEKVAIVRRIFDLAATNGLLAITRTMANVPVITAHKRAKWNQNLIRRILQNKAALGLVRDRPASGAGCLSGNRDRG
jgi:DNA invertase Pin-like site-specific DNA recombinase